VVRHFFVASPVAALSSGMAASPRRTTLIALSGALDRAAPGALRAVRGTIDLATVAAAADQSLSATTSAQKQPSRCCVGMIETAIATWTTAAIAGILSLHACPARCRARRRCGTAKFKIGAVLAPQEGEVLPVSAVASACRHAAGR
jgi:hypothetical protein